MHRIDSPSATADNKFTEGSPAGGVPATTVRADWLNDLQENVCEAIEASGLTLEKGDYAQLAAAIVALANGTLPKRTFGANDFIRIPDVVGGFIIQWGSMNLAPSVSTASVDTTFPLAFPTVCRGALGKLGILTTDYDSSPNYRLDKQSVSVGAPTATGFEGQAFIDNNIGDTRRFQWIAFGN